VSAVVVTPTCTQSNSTCAPAGVVVIFTVPPTDAVCVGAPAGDAGNDEGAAAG
jgi:hypothetical protein